MVTEPTSGGLVLLDKPPGATSFAALNSIKNALVTKKVGHSGTLDRFAHGLLVLLTGYCTRLASLFSGLDKRYTAVIRFGETTDTLDPEGEIVDCGKVPRAEEIEDALGHFVGILDQVPPSYSAVHHKGVRAYRLARAGREPRLPPRSVTVFQLEAVYYDAPNLGLKVHCSKGTYVRALARDLGKAVGSCAYLVDLVRTAVGDFRLEEAVAAEDFLPNRHVIRPIDFLTRLPEIQIVGVKPGDERRVRGGMSVDDSTFDRPLEDGTVAAFGVQNQLLALLRKARGGYKYVRVFAK